MTVVAFVPGPGAADAVVGWARAFVEGSEDGLDFLCWESHAGSHTEEAVRAALGDAPAVVTSLRQPDPVASVVARCRPGQVQRLVTCTFDLPGQAGTQTSDA